MNRIQFVITLLSFIVALSLIAQCLEIVWQDEFEKPALDASKWSFQIGDGCDLNICGWGNNELQ
ncbi:MAG: hypothetical protein P1U56_16795 [Saprospiraceae bacterium]|nr:hypothetical protein [Saprospiraceae bacterium]